MQQETAPGLYESDFALWAEEQAAALREGRLGDLDLENLAEEIADLARRQRSALLSRLIKLEFHLLKLQYQPEAASKSWHNTIREQARKIRRLLKETPSMRRLMYEFSAEAYADAREQAADETELPLATFPEAAAPELWEALLQAIGKDAFIF
jgi:hypothetical protein